MPSAETLRALLIFISMSVLLSASSPGQWQARLVDSHVHHVSGPGSVPVTDFPVQVSPSGRYLVYFRGRDDALEQVSYNIQSGQRHVLQSVLYSFYDDFQFVPGRDEIVTSMNDGLVWAALDGSFQHNLKFTRDTLNSPDQQHGPWAEHNFLFSPDDELLYLGLSRLEGFTRDEISSPRQVLNLALDYGVYPTGMTLSPDGQYLLIGSNSKGSLVLFPFDTEVARDLTPADIRTLRGYGFSPNGEHILCLATDADNIPHLYAAETGTSGTLRQIPADFNYISVHGFTPDGNTLLYRQGGSGTFADYRLELSNDYAKARIPLPIPNENGYSLTLLPGHPSRMALAFIRSSGAKRYFTVNFDGSDPIEFTFEPPVTDAPDPVMSSFVNFGGPVYFHSARQIARIVQRVDDPHAPGRLVLCDVDTGTTHTLQADLAPRWFVSMFRVDGDDNHVYLHKTDQTSAIDYMTRARFTRVPLDGGREEVIHEFENNRLKTERVTVLDPQGLDVSWMLPDRSLLLYHDYTTEPRTSDTTDLYALTPPSAAAPQWLQSSSPDRE